jgi:hypothetical protein
MKRMNIVAVVVIVAVRQTEWLLQSLCRSTTYGCTQACKSLSDTITKTRYEIVDSPSKRTWCLQIRYISDASY